jgi:DNA-binding XRE family transcriptional regulator
LPHPTDSTTGSRKVEPSKVRKAAGQPLPDVLRHKQPPTQLASYRRALGISQRELADATAGGVSRVAISNLETRTHRPQFATASRLATALGVDVAALFPEEENEN